MIGDALEIDCIDGSGSPGLLELGPVMGRPMFSGESVGCLQVKLSIGEGVCRRGDLL